jgi:mRNA-degrading endonuclease RelE of RelBE toxin-antitoxin system
VNGWRVELTRTAQRDFRKLDHGPRRAALDLIDELRESPALPHAF